MELAILKDIVIIFALSTLVNLVFNRIRIPTVVGYLLTGILAGPHMLSLIGERHQIELIAEIGVILLLFTIGMEFSLRHLLKIRRVVFFGGLLQVSLTAGLFYIASQFYGLDRAGGVFIGFLAALSSSALVLKLLQDRSEITSNYGRTVLGILIFQDILLVPLILFANLLGDNPLDPGSELLLLFLKAVLIIGLVYVGNKWLFPKLLHWIAMTKNQELFLMSIFLICLSVALLTSELGMSLAFGAFLAGLMISESEYSHNAFGNLIPIKDIFTSFFFVSIGMLLDMQFVIENISLVVLSVFLVLLIKTIIAGGTGFVLGHTFRGTVMVGLALSQVGEFSFILARIGLDNGIISTYYFQLFLAVAVITMAFTPLFMSISRQLADRLLRLPLPRVWKEGLFPLSEIDIPDLRDHLVIIGKDESAQQLSGMARYHGVRHVSIIFDPAIARERMKAGDTVVYGDAINEPILEEAHVPTADVVVISVGSVIPAMAIIERVKHLNKNAFVIARAKYIENVEELYKVGADQVLPEKLEIAIDLFNRFLVHRLYPQKEINRILNHLRSLNLGVFSEKDMVKRSTILDELPNVNIGAVTVEEGSVPDGKSVAEIELRRNTGVTLLALRRGDEIIEHPVPGTKLRAEDVAYLLGDPEQINLATELFSKK